MALFRTDSLGEPLTSTELTDLKMRRKQGHFGREQNNPVLRIVVVAMVLVMALFVVVPMFTQTMRLGLTGVSPFLLLWVVGFGLIAWRVVRRSVTGGSDRWARVARFAEDNELTYRLRSQNPAYPGLIFHQGSNRASHSHVFSATGPFADAGDYTYVTGSGDDKTTHRWRFAAFRLPRPMPHLLLDAKSNNMMGSNLPVSFSRDQRVSLGSPFDDHYTLYAPADYAPDAFFLFPPNVMEALLDATSDYDIEIVDDWMFLYTTSAQDLANPDTWRLFETIAESVVGGLTRVSQRYTDRRVSGQNVTPGEPVAAVAEGGRRLQTSGRLMMVVTTVGVFALWAFLNFVIF